MSLEIESNQKGLVMALSQRTKNILQVACADKKAALELSSTVDLNSTVAATVAAITTADATDLPSVITLCNANKAKINELIASLRAAGIVA